MASTLVRNFQVFKTSSEHLHKVCEPVTFPLSSQTQQNIAYAKSCFLKTALSKIGTVALSAPQIGINQRFFIFPKNFNYLKHLQSPNTVRAMLRSYIVVINPVIHPIQDKTDNQKESCLSSDGTYHVDRYIKIEAEFQNILGKSVKVTLEGFYARFFQHETDHLNGITIEDIGKIAIEQTRTEPQSIPVPPTSPISQN